MRSPRTTQELRFNQDKNDPYVRGKRRNLPTQWDDCIITKQKSWKSLGRDHQYREENENYQWREYHYSDEKHIHQCIMIVINIKNHLEKIGCYCEYIDNGIRWFGPDFSYFSR